MTAFDLINRTSSDPASHIISAFEYLNTSARPAAAAVRDVVDDMLSRYPFEHHDQLLARFRSSNDVAHLGAFFELFLHELLIRSGCAIIEVEPRIEGSRHSPDFFVEAPCGTRFYLEATTASGRSSASSAEERRTNEAIEAINCVASPSFLLGVSYFGRPTQSLSLGRLRRGLMRWLAELNDGTRTSLGGSQPAHWSYEENGISFDIEAFPRSQPSAGGTRSIGLLSPEGGLVEVHNAIRDVVKKKANDYRCHDVPYVVAVNTLEFSKWENFVTALFGTEVVRATRINGEWNYESARQANGLWRPNGARHTRVSAVVGVSRMSPWNLAQRQTIFIANPRARQPIELTALEIDRTVVEGDWMQILRGRPNSEIFALPPNWPEHVEGIE